MRSAFFEEMVGIRSRIGAIAHARGIVYPREKKSSCPHVGSGDSSSNGWCLSEAIRYIEYTSGGRERIAVVNRICERIHFQIQ
jgi:hypothetical protein